MIVEVVFTDRTCIKLRNLFDDWAPEIYKFMAHSSDFILITWSDNHSMFIKRDSIKTLEIFLDGEGTE